MKQIVLMRAACIYFSNSEILYVVDYIEALTDRRQVLDDHGFSV